MPTSEWNKKYWTEDIKKFQEGIRIEKMPDEKEYGERWGDVESNAALKNIVRYFIKPFVSREKIAIEIGPGGGRWTKYLLDFKILYLVDLNERSLDYVKNRFKDADNIQFCLNNGTDFPNISHKSVDYVFSFGTFVHIDLGDITEYFANLIKILSDKADIVLQYPEKLTKGGFHNMGYAQNTRSIMNEIIKDFGFKIESESLEHCDDSNIVYFTYEKPEFQIKTPDETICYWYEKLLKRTPDKASQRLAGMLETNELSEQDLISRILTSDEYKIAIDKKCLELINKP